MKINNIDSIVDEFYRIRGRNISIQINKQAKVIVKAPNSALISDINKFIELKRKWILKKKELILQKQNVIKKFVPGEKLLYLGIERELKFTNNVDFAVQYINGEFIINNDLINYAKEYFTTLYKNLAWNYFAPLTVELAKKYNFNFSNIKISSAKGKWGSCSNKGSINLVWRLIMAPEGVIKYVIIHELAHTKEMNHSPDFWKIVNDILPDYQKSILWLKQYGHLCDL
jgi:predicted metal-dependent hydrolase